MHCAQVVKSLIEKGFVTLRDRRDFPPCEETMLNLLKVICDDFETSECVFYGRTESLCITLRKSEKSEGYELTTYMI